MAKKSRIKKILVIFLEVLLIFGIVEGLLRVSGIDRAGTEQFYSDIYDPFTRFMPGARNPYTQIHEFINNKGFRGADFDNRKPPNVFRIVCLGDSRIFGMVPFQDAFPTILQNLLNEGPRKKRYEVINAGIPGTNLYQHRLFFENVFKNVAMDLVLLMPEPNYREDMKRFRDAMSRPGYVMIYQIQNLFSHTAIFRVLRRVVKGGAKTSVREDSEIQGTRNISQDAYLSDYREDLKKMLLLTRDRNCKLVLLSNINFNSVRQVVEAQLNPDDADYSAAARRVSDDLPAFQFARANNLLFIDLIKNFIVLNQNEPGLWVDDTHPGPIGNRIIAEKIAGTLSENGLLPDKIRDDLQH